MKFKSMLGHSALYLLASSATMLSVQAASADDKKHGVIAAGEIVWAPFDPSQPKGMQIAVLHGDPSKPGPFGVRLKIPAGLELGSHTHSNAEYVTIISGKAKVSWGVKADIAGGDDLLPGSFFWMNGADHHDFMAIDETVVEINSTGPFDLIPDK